MRVKLTTVIKNRVAIGHFARNGQNARFVEIIPGPAEKHAQACWEYLCEVSGCGMAYSDLVWWYGRCL